MTECEGSPYSVWAVSPGEGSEGCMWGAPRRLGGIPEAGSGRQEQINQAASGRVDGAGAAGSSKDVAVSLWTGQ